MPVTLNPPATNAEIDLAIATLRGNGCEGITGDMIIDCVAEQRRIDSPPTGESLLDKSQWIGADSHSVSDRAAGSVTLNPVPALDLAASLIAGLTDEDVQAKEGGEGRTIADVLAGIDAVRQLLRDLVIAAVEEEESDNLWMCGACGYESDEEFDRCPDCGVPDQCYEVR